MKSGGQENSDDDNVGPEDTGKQEYYPVKLVIPPNRSRFIFYKDKSIQLDWIDRLEAAMGNADVFQFY